MDAMAAQQAMSAAHMQALAPAGMPPGMAVAIPQLAISAPHHIVTNEHMAHLMAAAAMPQHMAVASDQLPSDQDRSQEGGEQLSYGSQDMGGEGMPGSRLGRKHSSDRRPLRFWQPFNDWWRTDLARLDRRPNAQEIESWYNSHADKLWGPAKPTLQETRVHAKCLRSLPLVRDYFRSYRQKKKARHGPDGSHDGLDMEHGTPGDDGMGTSQGGMETDAASADSRRALGGMRKLGPMNSGRKRAAPDAPMGHHQHMGHMDEAAAAQLAALGKMDLAAANAAMTPVEMMNLPGAGFWPQGVDPSRLHEENEYTRALMLQQLQHAAVVQQQMTLAAIAQQYPGGQFPAGVAMMPGQEMEEEEADTDDEADAAAAAAAAAAEAAAAAGLAQAEAQEMGEAAAVAAAAAAAQHDPNDPYVQQLRHYEEQQRLEQQRLEQEHQQLQQVAPDAAPQLQHQEQGISAELQGQQLHSPAEQQQHMQEQHEELAQEPHQEPPSAGQGEQQQSDQQQQQQQGNEDEQQQQDQQQQQGALGEAHLGASTSAAALPGAIAASSAAPLPPPVEGMEAVEAALDQVPAAAHDPVHHDPVHHDPVPVAHDAVHHDPMALPADQPNELMSDMAAVQQQQQQQHAQALAEQEQAVAAAAAAAAQQQAQALPAVAALVEQQAHVVPEVALVGEAQLAVMSKEQLADHIRALHEELLNKRGLVKRTMEQLQHTKEKLAKKKRRLQTATARNRQYQQVLMAWQASLVPMDPALAMNDMYQAQAAAAAAAAAQAHHAAAAHAAQTVPQGLPTDPR